MLSSLLLHLVNLQILYFWIFPSTFPVTCCITRIFTSLVLLNEREREVTTQNKPKLKQQKTYFMASDSFDVVVCATTTFNNQCKLFFSILVRVCSEGVFAVCPLPARCKRRITFFHVRWFRPVWCLPKNTVAFLWSIILLHQLSPTCSRSD